MEKTQVFLDYANINRGANSLGYDLDYGVLLHDHLASLDEGRFLVDAFAYVPVDPRQEYKNDEEIEALWKAGYLVNSKVGSIARNTYKCNFDIEMTMDIMKIAHETKPDIIVLATGDSDFIPLVKELRKKGIRVEIASFVENTSKKLAMIASGFINLNEYLEFDEEENIDDLHDEDLEEENEQIDNLQNDEE